MVDNKSIFVINGFYMDMRSSYVKDTAAIQYYLLSWDKNVLSWADFREKTLGATDPTKAAEGSLRNLAFKQWKDLGLSMEPNVGENAFHGSASPFEAFSERMNWLQKGDDIKGDGFGSELLKYGIPEQTVKNWCQDPQVELPDGGKGSLFDALEDTNVDDCLNKALKIAKVEAKVEAPQTNMALIFIKPGANNPKTIELLEKTLKEAKIFTVTSSGSLTGPVIEKNMLIDNHYGAIASKAMKLLPKELNPPQKGQDAFGQKFGVNWTDALDKGIVFNAKDAKEQLGKISDDKMAELWAVCKKADKLIKFGGGFYAGQIPL